MKDVIEHLVDDLDWRLSPAGKAYRPEDKELTSWGVERHGCWPTVLLWFAMMLLYVGLVVSLATGIDEDFFAAMGSMLGLVLTFFFGKLAGNINRGWQKNRDKQAYRKLLKSNERFMLVEYSKYLSRKVHQAQRDPALGGATEIARLRELQARINDMLRKGGNGRPGRQSRLEEEATIAESLLEAYGHEDYDPLKQLDQRLPADVRQRIVEADKKVQAAGSAFAGTAEQAVSPAPVLTGPAASATKTAAEPVTTGTGAVSAPAGSVPGPGQAAAAPAPKPVAASKADSELPRWARELSEIIESLDLDSVLSDDSRKGKSRSKE